MSCENPLVIKNPRYAKMSLYERTDYSRTNFGCDFPIDYTIEVPCGRCQSCEKSRMRSFQIRLLYELDKYPNSQFVTLTFDDANLAQFSSDPNRAVRLFLDRARKRFGKQLRHWFVAEYGSLHGRLHYHGILFNTPPDLDGCELARLWSYGFSYVGYSNEKTARYITKYVTKSCSGDKRPPRIISSKGIGADYLTPDNVSFHRDGDTLRPYLYYGSFKVPLPRYYYSKIFTDEDKVSMLLERTYNPQPKYLGSQKYFNMLDYVRDRRKLFDRNVRLGLSKKRPSKHLLNP